MRLLSRTERKPFISVYDGAAAQMVGQYVRSWNADQRQYREYRIRKTQGFEPLYRINIKLKHGAMA
jgi:hypothetical protein